LRIGPVMAANPAAPLDEPAPTAAPAPEAEAVPETKAVAPAEAPSDERPPTWAVVVVHGVGITRPGDTLQAFVPPFVRASGGNLEETAPPQLRLLYARHRHPRCGLDRKAEDGFEPEPPPEDASIDDLFPMHFREVQVQNARQEGKSAEQ